MFFSKFRNQEGAEQKSQQGAQQNTQKQEDVKSQENQQTTEQQAEQEDIRHKQEIEEKTKQTELKIQEIEKKVYRSSVEEILKVLSPVIQKDFQIISEALQEGGEIYLKEALKRLEKHTKELKATEEKVKKLSSEYEVLKKANEDVHKQMSSLKEKALGAIDEAAATRKRIEKEKEQMKAYAVSEFAKEILETVDNLGRALESCKDRAGKNDNLYDGVVATEKILLKTLEKFGIHQIKPLKEQFDPNQHEALMQYDDPNLPGGSVGIILSVGYKIQDRVLRPAKVGVVLERPDEKKNEQAKKE